MIKKLLTVDKLYLLLLIVILVLVINLSQNRYMAIVEARQSLQQTQQALTAEQLQLSKLQELEREGPRFLQRLALFDNLIPKKSSEGEIELYLNELAYLSGLHQFNVRFNVVNNFNDYLELPLSISMEGSFHNILQFIQALRQGGRVFRVDSLEMYVVNSDSGRLIGNIQVSTFYRN